MTTANRYHDRKRRKVCVVCESPDIAADRVRCPGCLADNNRVSGAYHTLRRMRGPVPASMADRHTKLSLYWSNHDVYREAMRQRRLEKKIAGQCRDCPADSLEDNVRCAECREKDLASKHGKRPRRTADAELAAYQPLDEVIDLTRVRVLRAARYLEWFATQDLNEQLEVSDETARNSITQAVIRLARAGMLERRLTSGGAGIRARSSLYEYRITPAGIADLEAVLSGSRVVRINHRRAA